MVREIDLPSQSGLPPYIFTYSTSGFGELSSVTLPYGAKADYTYWLDPSAGTAGCPLPPPAFPHWYDVLANYPCKKAVFWNGNDQPGTTPDESSTLAINQITDNNSIPYYTSSNLVGPDGGATTTKFYNYSYNAGSTPGNFTAGLVYEIDQPDGSVTTQTWAMNPLPGTMAQRSDCQQSGPICSNGWFPYDTQNPYVPQETRSVTGTGGTFTAQTTRTVDQNGNPLVTTEGDWSAGNPLIRTTTLTYFNPTSAAGATADVNVYWDSNAPSLLSLPLSKNINGPTSPTGYEQYCYDANGNLTLRASLLSGLPPVAACSNGGGSILSNAIGTQFAYGPHGVVVVAMDARGVATQFQYDSNILYVTEKDTACNQSLNSSLPCSLPETRRTAYTTDLNTGKVTVVNDLDNSAITTTQYDPFGRPTSVTDPTGAVTTVVNNDPGRYQMTTPPIPLAVSANCFDQMGRIIHQQTSENRSLTPCSGTQDIHSAMQYVYAAPGRYEWVSNPSRTLGEATMGWTRRAFDGAGRIVEEAHFAGDPIPTTQATPQARATYSYNGPCYTIYDEAANAPTTANPGSVRTICKDAAGRISTVTETIPGATPATQITTYSYDAMNNLASVAQGVQTRVFSYDAVGRLTSSVNPENGTISYNYDNNGNLIARTDARGVVMHATYDNLNRLLTKTYTDGTTPAVTYTYCQSQSGCNIANGRGRLTAVAVNGGTTVYYNAFDAMGRITQHSQQHPQMNGGNPYTFSESYTPGGPLQQITYPSGRSVTTNYDGAGRVSSVSGMASGVTTNYSGGPSGIQYAPQGAISSISLSLQQNLTWAVTEQWVYNPRLQPISISTISSSLDPIRALTFGYGTTENNGNLLSETISGTGLSGTASQSYTYDGANRIFSSSEGSAWSRGFNYDQYGNQWAVSPMNPTPTMFTPQANLYDANTNHSSVNTAMWDAAGRETTVGGYHFGYDAENRMTSATLVATTVYQYDGDGRRVAKIDCPSASTCDPTTQGASTTWYVYDPQGDLAAEYASTGTAAPCTTCYLTVDHLGSTRVMMDQNGTPLQCHDYLPFGEEVPSGAGGRTGCYGAGTGTGLLFTGQLRDAPGESGLDFFGARYFSGAQGRFTSADEPMVDQDESDPQSWNLYAYGRNNPLSFTDPTGRCSQASGGYTDEGKGLFPGPCSGGTIGGSGAGSSVTVSAKQGNVVSAIALNFFFALDNAANAFFSPLTKGIGVTPSYMQNTPTSNNWTGYAAEAGVFLMPGPGGKSGATERVGVWSETKALSRVQNAFKHWMDHRSEFPNLQNSKQYVEAAWEFVTNPPAGVVSKIRANGDVLLYDAASNTFGVKNAQGIPKTMFKPTDGAAYFYRQK